MCDIIVKDTETSERNVITNSTLTYIQVIFFQKGVRILKINFGFFRFTVLFIISDTEKELVDRI